jgi:hypothetical protein
MADQTLKNPNEAFQTGTDPALINATYSPGSQNTPVNVATIGTAPNINLPSPPTSAAYDISSLPTVSTLLNPNPTALDTQQTDLQGKLLADTKTLGTKTAAQSAAETAAGLPGFNAQLTDINGQLQTLQKENAAIPLQVQNDFAGRGATAGGVAPIQNEQLRNNSIKALGLSAIAQTLQGNVALAQQQANKAVELQFAPVQADIDYLTQALSINKDNLSRQDQKRAQTLTIQLAERQRLLDSQKADAEAVHSVANIAAKYGAPADILNKILSGTDYATALSSAAGYLQDPQAKYDLEGARLDNVLKQAQITKTKAETAQIGAPSAADVKAQLAATEQAKSTVPVLQDKINLIDSLLTSPGLASSVGPNPFARVPITADLTGAGQNFRAGVNQLINQQTLDALINLKAQGGTLGALSDSEGALLRQAATKIGSWEITSGPGAGRFNIDETSFKTELNTIKTLTQRALTNAQGNLIAPDEKSALDAVFGSSSSTSTINFNPANFY